MTASRRELILRALLTSLNGLAGAPPQPEAAAQAQAQAT